MLIGAALLGFVVVPGFVNLYVDYQWAMSVRASNREARARTPTRDIEQDSKKPNRVLGPTVPYPPFSPSLRTIPSLSSLSSSSPTYSSSVIPLLPAEIVEQIVDYLSDDTPSLCNLALASRVFLERSRHHLFASVHAESKARLEALYSLLGARTSLRCSVRSLVLSGVTEASLLEYVPVPLLVQLPNLRSWTISGNASVDADGRRHYLALNPLTLACLTKYATRIHRLTISSVSFVNPMEFIRLVSAFSSLHSLIYEGVQFRGGSLTLSLNRARSLLSRTNSVITSLDVSPQ